LKIKPKKLLCSKKKSKLFRSKLKEEFILKDLIVEMILSFFRIKNQTNALIVS